MTNQESIRILTQKGRHSLDDLREVMRLLRSPQGCPWDGEQNHHSIRSALIEETYEVIEAIDNEDSVLLREELGDLLFQIVFHSQIEQEQDAFCMDDVIHDITAKMIHRHPHVFGTVTVKDSGEVLSNWEEIKKEEKQRNTLVDKLNAIPPMLPALMRASKVGKKAELCAEVSVNEILDDLHQQVNTVRNEENQDPQQQIGRLLMSVTNLARRLGVDAEYALTQEINRTIQDISQKTPKN